MENKTIIKGTVKYPRMEKETLSFFLETSPITIDSNLFEVYKELSEEHGNLKGINITSKYNDKLIYNTDSDKVNSIRHDDKVQVEITIYEGNYNGKVFKKAFLSNMKMEERTAINEPEWI